MQDERRSVSIKQPPTSRGKRQHRIQRAGKVQSPIISSYPNLLRWFGYDGIILRQYLRHRTGLHN